MKKFIFSPWPWAILTIFYLIGVVSFPFYLEESLRPKKLNEWGDYFAGTVAPAALAWFVATLFLQMRELKLQREQVTQQNTHLQRQSQAAASTAFIEIKNEYLQILNDLSLSIWEKAPKTLKMHENNDVLINIDESHHSKQLLNYLKCIDEDVLNKNRLLKLFLASNIISYYLENYNSLLRESNINGDSNYVLTVHYSISSELSRIKDYPPFSLS